jgi:putative transposase
MTNRFRRSIRLRGYDYCSSGYYFVTVCTYGKINFFGELKDNRVILNKYVLIARREWIKTAHIRVCVQLDAFIIMPDHMHGILNIHHDNCLHSAAGATRRVAPSMLAPSSLGSIIGQYKSVVTKQIRKMGKTDFKWQRNYYDRVIWNEMELYTIRRYIFNNPIKNHNTK